jgi:hypothetical protein
MCLVDDLHVFMMDSGDFKLRLRVVLPDVDLMTLSAIWPDIEALCTTTERFDLASPYEGGDVTVELRDRDRKTLLHGTAIVDGKVRYARGNGTGTAKVVLVMECPEVDLRALLDARHVDIEQQQGELFPRQGGE